MNKQSQTIDLGRDPTPSQEAEDFSTADERADQRNKSHELDVLRQQQGPIGRLIGCSDSALTIAAVLLVFGAIAIVATFIGLMMNPEPFSGVLDKLITFELTVAGYVMGKKTSE